MATGKEPCLQPPHEVDENHIHHPKTSSPRSYSEVLQTKCSTLKSKAAASIFARPFKPFSVDSTTSLKGNNQSQSTLVFGDFESKNSCTLKPVVEYCGKKAIIFKKSDKQRLINKITHVLIGKFSHGKPKMSDLKEFFLYLKLNGSYNISIFDSKHIYIECDLFEDFLKIWLEKVWIVKGFQMRVFKWSADFTPQHESPVVPVWLHLTGLPLYLFEEEALMSIANAIGNPLYISSNNLNRSNLSYASLCVELDVTKPLLDEVWIEFGKEKMDSYGQIEEKRDGFWQKLSYGSIPSYCTFCFHIGHSWDSCKQSKGYGVQISGAISADVQHSVSGELARECLNTTPGAAGTGGLAGASAARGDAGAGELAAFKQQEVEQNMHLMTALKSKNNNTTILEEEVLVEDISLEEGEFVEANVYSKRENLLARQVRSGKTEAAAETIAVAAADAAGEHAALAKTAPELWPPSREPAAGLSRPKSESAAGAEGTAGEGAAGAVLAALTAGAAGTAGATRTDINCSLLEQADGCAKGMNQFDGAADLVTGDSKGGAQGQISADRRQITNGTVANVDTKVESSPRSWAELVEEEQVQHIERTAKEEENELQTRIISQLSPAEVKELVVNDIDIICATPNKVKPVFHTSPIFSNKYVRDKDGSPVPCSEIIEKSYRIVTVRHLVDHYKNQNGIDVMKNKDTYNKLMRMYNEQLLLTIEEHQQNVSTNHSTIETATPLSQEGISNGSKIAEQEWTPAKRKGGSRNSTK